MLLLESTLVTLSVVKGFINKCWLIDLSNSFVIDKLAGLRVLICPHIGFFCFLIKIKCVYRWWFVCILFCDFIKKIESPQQLAIVWNADNSGNEQDFKSNTFQRQITAYFKQRNKNEYSAS